MVNGTALDRPGSHMSYDASELGGLVFASSMAYHSGTDASRKQGQGLAAGGYGELDHYNGGGKMSA